MSRHDDGMALRQLVDRAREIVALTTARSREDLNRDRILYLALLQLLQITGEAANRLSKAFRESQPQVPWAEIIGLRNRLIHGYNTIDSEIIWKVVTVDVPALVASLETILPPNARKLPADN